MLSALMCLTSINWSYAAITAKKLNPLENKRKKLKVQSTHLFCKPLWLFEYGDPKIRLGTLTHHRKVREVVNVSLEISRRHFCVCNRRVRNRRRRHL